jgi:hypothetical protein
VQYGEAICLLCGFVIGEIKDGRFRHHAGCDRPLRQVGRLPRCCRCGGSLYVDPSLSTPRYAGMAGLGAVAGWDD